MDQQRGAAPCAAHPIGSAWRCPTSPLQAFEQPDRGLDIPNPLGRVHAFPLNRDWPSVTDLPQLPQKSFDTNSALAKPTLLSKRRRLPLRRPIAVLTMDREHVLVQNAERF